MHVGDRAGDDEPVREQHVALAHAGHVHLHAGAGVGQPALVRRGIVLAHEQQDERERLGALRVERRPQARPGARDPLARRVLGDPEHAPELAQREAGLEAQHEHGAVGDRQLRERRAGLLALGRREVPQLRGGAPGAAAQLVEREVARGAVHPRGEHRRGCVARRPRPGARERLLAQVGGGLGIAGHAPQPPVERALLGREDGLQAHGANHPASAAAVSPGALSIGMCPEPAMRRSVAPGISAA